MTTPTTKRKYNKRRPTQLDASALGATFLETMRPVVQQVSREEFFTFLGEFADFLREYVKKNDPNPQEPGNGTGKRSSEGA